MNRRTLATTTAVLLTVGLLASTSFLVRQSFFGPKTITADFPTATAIYPGDQVRVAGVKVGTITSIDPQPTLTRLTMAIDRDVPIRADAKAVIVAQNLISARYVQLTPAYQDSGPQMPDGAQIPIARTAVPVEWDEVKTQLTRLATELGPSSGVSDTATARFIDSAADAMAGNGEKLRQTLAQLSGVGRILADGSGNIVDVIKNLQTFISALRESSTQIVQFQGRLATLTSVLDGSRSDLDGALTNVSEVVSEVQRFVRGTRQQTSEQIQRLANVTQNVVDHSKDLEQILHVAPTAIANTLNMFDPRDGGATGIFTLSNISNPIQFLCGAIGAVENVTAAETAKLCAQYLGPALKQLNFNYIPLPINPVLTPAPLPENLLYTDPALAPGGGGRPSPPEVPPAVSAFTGAGDVPPPPGYGPPQPPPAPSDLRGLMLPPQAVSPTPSAPLPAEAPIPADPPPPGGTPPQ
jgi:virulence factor Mce-like protein